MRIKRAVHKPQHLRGRNVASEKKNSLGQRLQASQASLAPQDRKGIAHRTALCQGVSQLGHTSERRACSSTSLNKWFRRHVPATHVMAHAAFSVKEHLSGFAHCSALLVAAVHSLQATASRVPIARVVIQRGDALGSDGHDALRICSKQSPGNAPHNEVEAMQSS